MHTFVHICTLVVSCDVISLLAPWLVASSANDADLVSVRLFGKADYTRAAGLCFIVVVLCDLVAISGARKYYKKDGDDKKNAKSEKDSLRKIVAGCFWAILLRGIALWFMKLNFSVTVKDISLAAGMVFSLVALAIQLFVWAYTLMTYTFDSKISPIQTLDVVAAP
eukprot:GEMP01076004.1.p1 GENE.GEMP01076004.1~~GEMP01076004.1.p1  ORF type:complete len:166 (+),score=30.87 GEMP01076004.1:210-707(+)